MCPQGTDRVTVNGYTTDLCERDRTQNGIPGRQVDDEVSLMVRVSRASVKAGEYHPGHVGCGGGSALAEVRRTTSFVWEDPPAT